MNRDVQHFTLKIRVRGILNFKSHVRERETRDLVLNG